MSNDSVANLKACVKQYCSVDDEVRELNKQIQTKREDRKIIETRLSDIINNPQFQVIDKLKIDDDGSTIRIKRPNTYQKPWSLSKKELRDLLDKYFMSAKYPSSEDCFQFISQQNVKTATEFDFTRVFPGE